MDIKMKRRNLGRKNLFVSRWENQDGMVEECLAFLSNLSFCALFKTSRIRLILTPFW